MYGCGDFLAIVAPHNFLLHFSGQLYLHENQAWFLPSIHLFASLFYKINLTIFINLVVQVPFQNNSNHPNVLISNCRLERNIITSVCIKLSKKHFYIEVWILNNHVNEDAIAGRKDTSSLVGQSVSACQSVSEALFYGVIIIISR